MDSKRKGKQGPEGGTFGLVFLLGVLLLPAFAIANGNNTAAAIATGFVFIGGLLLYFAPALIASKFKHPSATGIGVLNFFLGWTVLGWVVALVWSFTGYPDDSTEDHDAAPVAATRPCPFCAEDIRVEAIKCKHCGSEVGGEMNRADLQALAERSAKRESVT